MPEWERFALSRVSSFKAELTTVRHIAHVPLSRRIVEDGRIRAGLVYDESRLNRSRISVTWVSANTWAYGSIYGTVEFQFDWKDVLGNKGIYWVEAMEYRPAAYRFLLTERSIPSRLALPYDPLVGDGPLLFSGGKWYWNAEFTSEFMIEEDLRLTRSTGIEFVSHHPRICRASPACKDLRSNPTPAQTGGRLLSFVLGHDIHSLDIHLKPSQDSPADRDDLLDTALDGIKHALIDETEFGGALTRNDSCENAVRGALALYGMDQSSSARKLVSLIKSTSLCKRALTRIVRDHFNSPGWSSAPD